MTTTRPVDSATRPCCKGIGAHTPDCATTNPYPEVSFPAGAVLVDGWNDLDTAAPFRYFEGSRWVVDRRHHDTDVEVWISGTQHHDGSVSREIVVHELHADYALTVKEVRQLAAALTAAADEAEQMAGYDQIGWEAVL